MRLLSACTWWLCVCVGSGGDGAGGTVVTSFVHVCECVCVYVCKSMSVCVCVCVCMCVRVCVSEGKNSAVRCTGADKKRGVVRLPRDNAVSRIFLMYTTCIQAQGFAHKGRFITWVLNWLKKTYVRWFRWQLRTNVKLLKLFKMNWQMAKQRHWIIRVNKCSQPIFRLKC
jgi:hypothetical protein